MTVKSAVEHSLADRQLGSEKFRNDFSALLPLECTAIAGPSLRRLTAAREPFHELVRTNLSAVRRKNESHVARAVCEPHASSSSSLTDEELLLGYRDSSDPDLFSELVHRYERELYSYLRRYLGDAEMAEDAFQAAFLQVHLKCQQYEPGRAFRPWLYTIATNQAIDAQRRSRRHRMVSLDRAGPTEGEDVGKLLDLLTSKEPTPTAQLSSDRTASPGCIRRSSNCPQRCAT